MGKDDAEGKHYKKTFAQSPSLEPIVSSKFKRRCFRCGRPIAGWSFRTLYGYVTDADGTRRHACGEPLHDICDNAVEIRPIVPDFPPMSQKRAVDKYISLNEATGRYEVCINKLRHGTFATIDAAIAARDEVLSNDQANAI